MGMVGVGGQAGRSVGSHRVSILYTKLVLEVVSLSPLLP